MLTIYVTLSLLHLQQSYNVPVTGFLTECDGLQVDGMQEVGEQCPLQAQHVPAQDLIAAAHGSQSLTMLDAIPGGHNGT